MASVDGLYTAFKDSDGTIDPKFSEILSGNACKFVLPTTRGHCATVVKGASNIGLLSLLSRLYVSANNVYSDYMKSNRSATVQYNMAVSAYSTLGVQIYVIRDLLIALVDQTRTDFFDAWSATKNYVTFVTIFNMILLVISGNISWKSLFEESIEYFNRFKIMMKVVPGYVLLKTSSLKGLLIISSQGKLDAIKNEL